MYQELIHVEINTMSRMDCVGHVYYSITETCYPGHREKEMLASIVTDIYSVKIRNRLLLLCFQY